MIWITADDVIQIHSLVIQRSGGMDLTISLEDLIEKLNATHGVIKANVLAG